MKGASYPVMIAVSGETFTEAIEKVNKVVFEHRHQSPRYEQATDDGLNWIVHYTQSTTIIETLADEMEAMGKEVSCINCKYYKTIQKVDGTPDERTKKGYCLLWQMNVYKTSKARSECYERFLKEGEKDAKQLET